MPNDCSLCFEVTRASPRNQGPIRTFRIFSMPLKPHDASIISLERIIHEMILYPNSRPRCNSYVGIPTRKPHHVFRSVLG